MLRLYRQIWDVFQTYRREYGGMGEWVSSPFVHMSLLAAILVAADVIELDWRGLALAALPTILGFSLAAYTITFTLMGSSLHSALRAAIHPRRRISLLMMVNVTFFHVVLIQTLSFVYVLVTKGDFFWRQLGDTLLFRVINGASEFIGAFLVVYSILLLISIAVAMFRLGRLSRMASEPSAPQNETAPPTTPQSDQNAAAVAPTPVRDLVDNHSRRSKPRNSEIN